MGSGRNTKRFRLLQYSNKLRPRDRREKPQPFSTDEDHPLLTSTKPNIMAMIHKDNVEKVDDNGLFIPLKQFRGTILPGPGKGKERGAHVQEEEEPRKGHPLDSDEANISSHSNSSSSSPTKIVHDKSEQMVPQDEIFLPYYTTLHSQNRHNMENQDRDPFFVVCDVYDQSRYSEDEEPLEYPPASNNSKNEGPRNNCSKRAPKRNEKIRLLEDFETKNDTYPYGNHILAFDLHDVRIWGLVTSSSDDDGLDDKTAEETCPTSLNNRKDTLSDLPLWWSLESAKVRIPSPIGFSPSSIKKSTRTDSMMTKPSSSIMPWNSKNNSSNIILSTISSFVPSNYGGSFAPIISDVSGETSAGTQGCKSSSSFHSRRRRKNQTEYSVLLDDGPTKRTLGTTSADRNENITNGDDVKDSQGSGRNNDICTASVQHNTIRNENDCSENFFKSNVSSQKRENGTRRIDQRIDDAITNCSQVKSKLDVLATLPDTHEEGTEGDSGSISTLSCSVNSSEQPLRAWRYVSTKNLIDSSDHQ